MNTRFSHLIPIRLALCVAMLAMATACTPRQAVRMTPAPVAADPAQAERIAYVDAALKLVHEHALFAGRVDWPAAERRLHDAAKARPSTAALYPELDWLLQQLGDDHSFLQLSQDAQERYLATTGAPFRSTVTHAPLATRFRHARVLSADDHGRLRRVTVPSMMGDEAAQTAYARTLASLLTRGPRPCGVMLDFRGNGGGNMWPMIAGLSPLFSSATLGAFVEPGARTEIRIRSGAVLVSKDGQDQQVIALADWRADPALQAIPLAILLDAATGSSGEIVPILLSARPHVRSFGQATYGASTSTEGFPLSDGANLVVVTSGVADAKGVMYRHGLTPDHPVAFLADAVDGRDPDEAAAMTWFREMRCR